MPRFRELADLVTLCRWLGPWADGAAAPGVSRAVRTPERLGKAYLYAPRDRTPAGAYLIAPGLHHQGPDDPRLDRFCRALAASGILVLAPFLPDFLRLRLAPGTADHLAAAFDDLERVATSHGLGRPAVFSISFGSMPAVALAARDTHRDRLGALVIFGGFADFQATMRFALSGVAERGGERVSLPRDTLNSPAVFLNLLPHLEVQGDRVALEAAWYRMVEQTWGRMELKAPGKPHAHAIAATLAPELQERFLMGCGLHPGGLERVDEVLGRRGDAFSFFDPRLHLARLRAPVYLVHGRDDDVIPWFEAEKIRDALPRDLLQRFLITGMASHTGTTMPAGAMARELLTLVRTVRAIHDAPRLG